MGMPSAPGPVVSAKFRGRGLAQHLVEVLISLLLAPVMAFVVSCAVYSITVIVGKASDPLISIFWDFLYAEVLFSIAVTCMMIILGSEYRVQMKIKHYIGHSSKVYSLLRKVCTLVVVVLFLFEVVYKVGIKHGYQVQNCWIFNVALSVGFGVCVITQCMSHPEAYFGL